jgi:hypothetical protein
VFRNGARARRVIGLPEFLLTFGTQHLPHTSALPAAVGSLGERRFAS